MAQYNVNPPDEYRRDTGMGTVLAVLLVLALVAFLFWALAFGGFNSLTGASSGTTPSYSTSTGATSTTSGVTNNPSSGSSTSPGYSGSTSGNAGTAPIRP